MIYINKNQDTTVITDSIINYVPTVLSIYFDETLVGTYNNLSTDVNYIRFFMPVADTNGFVEKEYIMKIVTYSTTIKEELIIVKDNSVVSKYEYERNTNNYYYER